MADVKLTLGNILQVSRRYLPLFLSYRENPAGGGGAESVLPAGRVLRCFHMRGRKKTGRSLSVFTTNRASPRAYERAMGRAWAGRKILEINGLWAGPRWEI